MNPHSLLIDLRFHEGRYHGERDAFDRNDGWPPSPARLFQALVAAAAVGARISKEDWYALHWLERLDPPYVAAPPVFRGRPVKFFVPNNDLDSVGGDPSRVSQIRVAKEWRPCFFNAEEPIRYVWNFHARLDAAKRICTIASYLCQLGRGIDMAWAVGQIMDPTETDAILECGSGVVRRPIRVGNVEVPHPGTLESLVDRNQRLRQRLRFVREGRRAYQEFIQPPKATFQRIGYDVAKRRLHFELRTQEGNFVPQPLASAASLIAVLLNGAALKLTDAIPDKQKIFDRLIVGRGADSSDLALRIRLIPIPSIGTVHTDPSIRRIIAEIPQDCPIPIDDLRWAFSELVPRDPRTGVAWSGRLVSTEDSTMTDRFLGPAYEFRSLTPLALPTAQRRRIDPTQRTTNPKGGAERIREETRAVHAVRQSLRHAGIVTRPVSIRVQKEPFDRRGERAEAFAADTRFQKHALWHASVSFVEPVTGPVIIGDGRFLGLGLMQPIEPVSGVIVFSIRQGLTATADSRVIAQAARRAMLARVQARLPQGGDIPSYVTGHEPTGAPLRRGSHRHLSIVVDLRRERILFIAPTLTQRSGIAWKEIRENHMLAEQALRGLDFLLAGRAGRLDVALTALDQSSDPLFAPSTEWETVTEYAVARHTKRISDEEALKADVRQEIERRGWPQPIEIKVLSMRRGPRQGLFGRLFVRFVTAQPGLLLIGRTSHQGGGLFAHSESPASE